MAGVDNLDLLQTQQAIPDTHTHQPEKSATHDGVYTHTEGKCTNRRQVLLDDESNEILIRRGRETGSMNAVIRAALKYYEEKYYGRND
jgi:hypothetical protein